MAETVKKKQIIVDGFICYCDSNNIHIVDSYKVKNIEEFIDQLINIVEKDFKYKRAGKAWVAEWYAHNLAYKFGILRNHTKDVDLNDDEYTLAKILYWMAFPFAKIICR